MENGKVNASFDVVEIVKSYVLNSLKTHYNGDNRELIYNRAFVWSGDQKKQYYDLKNATRSEKEKEVLQNGLDVEAELFDKNNIKSTLDGAGIDFEEDAGFLYLTNAIQKRIRLGDAYFDLNDKIKCIAMPDAIVFDKTKNKYIVIDCKASSYSKCQTIQRNQIQSTCELMWVVKNWEMMCDLASENCTDFVKSKIELKDLIGCVYYANDNQTDFVEGGDFDRMMAEVIKSFEMFVEDIDNKKFKKREVSYFFENPELPDNIFDEIITDEQNVENKFETAFKAFEAVKDANENLKLAKQEADKYYGAIKQYCKDNRFYFNVNFNKTFASGLSITITKTKDIVKTPEMQLQEVKDSILTQEQIDNKVSEFKQQLEEQSEKSKEELKKLQCQYDNCDLLDVIVRNGSISVKVND